MIETMFKNANILIVDDQQSNIDLLEGFLEMEGYINLKTTTDPREVVHLYEYFKPDLILLDLSMPYLTGFEVMLQLKPIIPVNTLVPILVLTADITREAKQKALSGGASDFLTKPFDLVEVGLRIRNLLFTNHLMHQLENQNQILEDKVKERTYELEQSNLELIIARDKAEASDRLKTAFLQTISHEIRTPLNGILGFGSLLVESESSHEERTEYFNMMQTSSNRLINTITDYVDMALIVSGNVDVNSQSVNVFKLLEEFKIKYLGTCEAKNIVLNFVLPEDLLGYTIDSDIELLQKIISHLIENAIKFTRHGEITVGFYLTPQSINIFVKDTGVGIEEENQKVIFEKFMQENITITRNFEGSGLGLSITKGLLQLLGGEIRLESVKGEGATFYISLPILYFNCI